MSETLSPKTTKRTEPNQKRSQATLDKILFAAADLLIEKGFEDVSTNMICRRAGVTPPALYRYFPNKYAVLKALGEALMQRQNALLNDWAFDAVEPDNLARELESFLAATLNVTRHTHGGQWIMRSLHATPILADVRLHSHRRVASHLCDQLQMAWPHLDREQLYQTLRLGVEMGYGIIEMVFDEPDLDEPYILQTAATALAAPLQKLIALSPHSPAKAVD